jgi:pyruvate dehydrogenase E1 component alpha subunit
VLNSLLTNESTGVRELGLDFATAKKLLYQMKRIRVVEESIAGRYDQGKMRCPVHLSTGQEGVAAAVGLALKTDDYAVSGHRAHAHYLAKGGDLPKMLAEIYGKASGCSSGHGGSMHLIDESVGFMGSTAIVGGTIPVGVGLALGIQIKKTAQVSCVFLGDGAVEEGAFYESVNFAAVRKLPVLFLCENNFYSVYSSLRSRQPKGRSIAHMVEAMGLVARSGSGNNVVEVYSMTRRSVDEIRAGQGPQFLEFTTYRWREHCGPNFDNDIGYRSEQEYLDWRAKEPIAEFEKTIRKIWSNNQSELDSIETKIEAEVELAFRFAEDAPFPQPQDASRYLFK